MSERGVRPRTGRTRIIQAAYELFSVKGFDAVSMQHIATASGVTKATLYHHFHDKEALFEAIARMVVDQTRSELEGALVGETLREQLVSLARHMLESRLTDQLRVLSDVRRRADEAAFQAFWASVERPWSILVEPLRQAVEAGEIGEVDTELTARMVYGSLMVQPFFQTYERLDASTAAHFPEDLVDTIMNGLRPRSS